MVCFLYYISIYSLNFLTASAYYFGKKTKREKNKFLLEKPHLECQKGKKAKGSVIAYAPHPNLQRNLASESLGPRKVGAPE